MIASGIRSTLRSAIRSGIDPSIDGPEVIPPPPADWIDGPLGVKRPYCAEHWSFVGPGIMPTYLFPMQEASGNLVDVANNPGGVLVPTASTLMGQTAAGWNAKYFRCNAESTGLGALATVSQLWNIGNQSIVMLGYFAIIQSTGNTRCLMLGGGGNGLQVQALSAGTISCFSGAATVGSFVYENLTQTFYPIALEYDRRGAGAVAVTTNKERITGSFVNYSDNAKGLGSPTLPSPKWDCNLFVAFTGYDAEALIDYGVKQQIADLGWPMAF